MTFQLDVFTILNRTSQTLDTLAGQVPSAELAEDARHAAAKVASTARKMALEPLSAGEIREVRDFLTEAYPAFHRLAAGLPDGSSKTWLFSAIEGVNGAQHLMLGMIHAREAIPVRPEEAQKMPKGFRKLIPTGWWDSFFQPRGGVQ